MSDFRNLVDGVFNALYDASDDGVGGALGRRPSEPYTLSGAVAEICDRVGMPPGTYDVTRLTAFVDGLIVSSSNPAYTYISTLAGAAFFDPSNYDGVLHFIHRGGDVVATIDEGDILEDVDEEDELQRKDSLVVPRVLHYQYMDLSGGLQPDMQHSDRSADNRSTGELSSQTPLILRTDDAQRIAVISHKVAIEEQRGEYHLSLPDSYLELVVGDAILYLGNRLRIFDVMVEDGFQRYKCAFDRKSAYQSKVAGVVGPLPEDPVSLAPGPTRIEIMDTPIIAAADDSLGYYVAISGEEPAWQGARVEFSMDGGQNYLESQVVTGDVIMGDLETELPIHSVYYPDETHTFQVRIQTPNAELQSSTLADMMNRQNLALVGDELVNIGGVNEVEPGLWECSYLLRGRKGTEVATHAIGSRFVLMERVFMVFLPAETYDLGQTLTFRATTLGTDIETVESFVFDGVSQTEREPAYLKAVRTGNDLDITWQGVGRLGGRHVPRHSEYFTGYRVEVDGQTVDTQDQAATLTVSAGSHTLRVYQRNAFTGNGPPAEVVV